MAQTGYTPILIYASGTTTNVPLAANLTSSASGAELAINYADGKLFYKSSGGVVTLLASAAGASGSVTSVAASVPSFLSISGSPITTSGTLAISYSGTALPIANGGTGATSANLTAGSGVSISGTWPNQTISATGSGGTVTSVAASVPAFLSITGSPITGSGTLAITYSGTALPIANGGTGATTLAGANIPVTNAANTFSATQTFSGTSSTFASVLLNAAETTTVSATAATGTIAYYVNSQSVLYYTTNASANWTVNVAFSAGTSLNTALAIGQTVTIAFLVTQGATAYYASAFQVDGVAVTPKWQGGTAPAAGNASSVDVYTYTITKTASATYTVLASQTQFK